MEREAEVRHDLRRASISGDLDERHPGPPCETTATVQPPFVREKGQRSHGCVTFAMQRLPFAGVAVD
jgi:hypothetical protein